MATLSVTIPDAITARVVDAVVYGNGYTDTIPDPSDMTKSIPNPVTKAQYAKSVLKNWIKSSVMDYEAFQAAETARIAAINSVNSEIVLGD